ncbi:hypothetical protein [Actinomadura rubrisoli]|uniref:Uncharacterized protein n=1 Tax=Actinomadura rubrisoli TaxID=2530368 RepID=A0A4R4ZXJ9_9ACTN|nr:hypothetical protein [Actinomadura rubrisoli]TDD63330.1 hypothetical protein E1298_43940 [Actinomadura rubrisoli]
MDGGVYSVTKLVLAAGHGRVLLIAPMEDPALDVEITAVTGQGGRDEVIRPDEASPAAFGTAPLDPATRTPSVEAGLKQGRTVSADIGSFWA